MISAAMGITMPGYPELVSASVGAMIVVAAWFVSVLAGRRLGPSLAGLWERNVGARNEGIGDRMCGITRHATAALLIAIALAADTWPQLASLILGLGLGTAAAFLVRDLVRGLHLPRWLAMALGAVAFGSIVADALGGLRAITGIMDEIGFTVGSMRISLLTIATMLISLAVLFALVRLASRVINHSINRATGFDPTQRLLAQKLSSVALLVVAFFIGIDLVGIDLTALAVFSGAFGLAIGFGLQKTVGNLIAGIILLMDRSIKPGDVIAVGDSFGSVNKIGVRAVSIITREAKEHLIPNELLMTEEVVNWSYSSRNVRVSIPVGVGYGCDLALAQRLMIEAAAACDRVLKDPSPKVWLREFGDNSVNHEIRLWIRDPEDGIAPVRSDVLNRLWDLFKEHEVELPFPQRDVHIKEWPGRIQPPPA